MTSVVGNIYLAKASKFGTLADMIWKQDFILTVLRTSLVNVLRLRVLFNIRKTNYNILIGCQHLTNTSLYQVFEYLINCYLCHHCVLYVKLVLSGLFEKKIVCICI